MLGKIIINLLVLLGLLLYPAWGEDTLLPAGVVNTASEDFGNIISGVDYGLGNVVPVEEAGLGERREIRIFRSPELRLSRYKDANLQVLLGNVESVYVWVESPPVRVNLHLTVDLLYQDGTRRTLFSRDMNSGVVAYVSVEPHTRIDCKISTKTTAIKLNRRFVLTVSPLKVWAIWPEFMPIPYRTFFE
ncbi:MAG: hypothetical protein ACYDIC_11070 [Desulfobaccales bacterium]